MSYAIVRIERKWYPDRRIWIEIMTKVAGQAKTKLTAIDTRDRLTKEIETDDIEYHRLLAKPQIPIYNDQEVEEGEELEHIGNQTLTESEEKWMTKYQSLGESKIIRYEIQTIGKW